MFQTNNFDLLYLYCHQNTILKLHYKQTS